MADDMKIKGIDDLKEAQAGAAMNGNGVPNYSDWQKILLEFSDNGVQSTGNYEGDLALYNSMMQPEKPLGNVEETRIITNKDLDIPKDQRVGATENVTKLTDSDSDQNLKATFANATSSTITGDYMRYFHQL